MEITVNEFLGASYKHGYIKVINEIPIPHEIIWEGNFETIDNHIPWDIHKMKVSKWGIENNGIVIYVRLEKKENIGELLL